MNSQNIPIDKIRLSTVDGLFYPKSRSDLIKVIEHLFNTITLPSSLNNITIKALISPHAGYEYSGLTAAYGYKALKNTKFTTAIILAPSHFARFYGAVLTNVDYYQTPLGLIPINKQKTKILLKSSLFTLNPEVQIIRPSWASYTSNSKSIYNEDSHTWEHSIEVQLPFLQYINSTLDIVPILLTNISPYDIAQQILQILDEQTIIIASSDLSHYHPQDEAIILDKNCIKDICDFNFKNILTHQACGIYPIAILMEIAKQLNWIPSLLDYRDSSYSSKDKNSVVGYTSIIYS